MCVARSLPARVRDLPDSAVRALAAPALRGPGRRAACDSRARRSRSGTPLGFGGGPGLEVHPAGGEAGGGTPGPHASRRASSTAHHPRADADLMVGFVKWRP